MRVWLVISSYRNDEDVTRILDHVKSGVGHDFDRILVVDSEGTGAIPILIKERGWTDVEYRDYEENLGSGGNLCERLRAAAEGGADFAYALNHDGNFDAGVFRRLLEAAGSLENLGAAYPLSFLINARGYNITGTRELPLPTKLVRERPRDSLIDVFWSSSNGALYSLAPVKQGIRPPQTLDTCKRQVSHGRIRAPWLAGAELRSCRGAFAWMLRAAADGVLLMFVAARLQRASMPKLTTTEAEAALP